MRPALPLYYYAANHGWRDTTRHPAAAAPARRRRASLVRRVLNLRPRPAPPRPQVVARRQPAAGR
jgi:hypothetical protein